MDDETAEMARLTEEMREVMAKWVQEPDSASLKARFRALQQRYQRLFVEYKQRQLVEGAGA